MSVLVSSLKSMVRNLIGDIDSTNYRFEDAAITSAIQDAVYDFNADIRVGQEYDILGTGNAQYYSPDITDKHKRIMAYFAAVIMLLGELAKAGRDAISYSNPAGSTNTTSVPGSISTALNNMKGKLESLLNEESSLGISGDVSCSEITTQKRG